mmetsp:Transcript_121509/g.339137  ORF Transcript_121509/g.339137 Transcript_121509/m.339137 type:complete len:206 (+) Transcript_121509:493-1110(+)
MPQPQAPSPPEHRLPASGSPLLHLAGATAPPNQCNIPPRPLAVPPRPKPAALPAPQRLRHGQQAAPTPQVPRRLRPRPPVATVPPPTLALSQRDPWARACHRRCLQLKAPPAPPALSFWGPSVHVARVHQQPRLPVPRSLVPRPPAPALPEPQQPASGTPPLHLAGATAPTNQCSIPPRPRAAPPRPRPAALPAPPRHRPGLQVA